MGEKNFIQKLKLSLTGIGLIGFSYFNANAQENYVPKYNTIAHKMLMIEDSAKYDIKNYQIFPELKTLDNLIDSSKLYIKQKENYSKKEIAEIADKIYLSILENMPEMEKRKETDFCYRNSLIYLAIGEINNLHFYASINQGTSRDHMFIRDDKDGKHDASNPNNPINKGDINIESTNGKIQNDSNGVFSDRYYIESKRINKQTLENNLSLSNLNENELLSIAYLQRGGIYSFKGQEAKIKRENLISEIKNKKDTLQKKEESFLEFQRENDKIKDCEKERNSEYIKMKIFNRKAFEDFSKAIKLNPKNLIAYTALGEFFSESPYIYEPMKDPEFSRYYPEGIAIKNLNKALELDSLNPKVKMLLGALCLRNGEYENSVKNYTSSLEIIEKKINEEKNNYKLSWEIFYSLKKLKMDCFSGRALSYKYLGEIEKSKTDEKNHKELIPLFLIDEKELRKNLEEIMRK